VTDSGSKTSHAVIVARSMKIPCVVGVRDLTKRVRNGDWAIVDGYDGVVIVNPSESTLFRYGKIQEQKKAFEPGCWRPTAAGRHARRRRGHADGEHREGGRGREW
jgi:phosphoenolpyruvate-protein kinase (PTS system EI component)